MNQRQYSYVFALGFAATLLFPALSPEEVMLHSGGEIYIAPGAGHTEWQDFTAIGDGMKVSVIERSGTHVMFNLHMDDTLYAVRAKCGPVQVFTTDPEVRADKQRVITATSWVCNQ